MGAIRGFWTEWNDVTFDLGFKSGSLCCAEKQLQGTRRQVWGLGGAIVRIGAPGWWWLCTRGAPRGVEEELVRSGQILTRAVGEAGRISRHAGCGMWVKDRRKEVTKGSGLNLSDAELSRTQRSRLGAGRGVRGDEEFNLEPRTWGA